MNGVILSQQDADRAAKGIFRDFGEGFDCRGFYTPAEVKRYWQSLETGTRTDLPQEFRGCGLVVFSGGEYPKVLRLSLPIPTFDSFDREYDSWHDLFLIPQEDGTVAGLYARGGYELAGADGIWRIEKYPSEIRELLDTM